MLPGVLMYDNGINVNEEIVIMTTKGEAVALGKYISKNMTLIIFLIPYYIFIIIKKILLDFMTVSSKFYCDIISPRK